MIWDRLSRIIVTKAERRISFLVVNLCSIRPGINITCCLNTWNQEALKWPKCTFSSLLCAHRKGLLVKQSSLPSRPGTIATYSQAADFSSLPAHRFSQSNHILVWKPRHPTLLFLRSLPPTASGCFLPWSKLTCEEPSNCFYSGCTTSLLSATYGFEFSTHQHSLWF